MSEIAVHAYQTDAGPMLWFDDRSSDGNEAWTYDWNQRTGAPERKPVLRVTYRQYPLRLGTDHALSIVLDDPRGARLFARHVSAYSGTYLTDSESQYNWLAVSLAEGYQPWCRLFGSNWVISSPSFDDCKLTRYPSLLGGNELMFDQDGQRFSGYYDWVIDYVTGAVIAQPDEVPLVP